MKRIVFRGAVLLVFFSSLYVPAPVWGLEGDGKQSAMLLQTKWWGHHGQKHHAHKHGHHPKPTHSTKRT
jgi:hypothetical protein